MTSELACPVGAGGKDVAVPKPYPEEFRQDVVRVARNRGPGVTVEQVAADFGVHAMTLWKWMRRADIDEGPSPERPARRARNSAKHAGGSSCWNRRTRACAGPLPTCPRRTCRENDLTARERAGRRRGARHGHVPGPSSSPDSPTTAGSTSPVTNAEFERATRANALFDAHREDPEFGYRFPGRRSPQHGDPAWRTGPRGGFAGTTAGGASSARRAGELRRPDRRSSDDLVRRDFTAAGPQSAVAHRHHRTPHR